MLNKEQLGEYSLSLIRTKRVLSFLILIKSLTAAKKTFQTHIFTSPTIILERLHSPIRYVKLNHTFYSGVAFPDNF